MTTFTTMCTCGDPIAVKAATRAEAAQRISSMWGAREITEHMRARHPHEEIPRTIKAQKLLQSKLIPDA